MSTTYQSSNVPDDPAALPGFLRQEFLALKQASEREQPFLELQVLNASPTKIREGMVVCADGTNWQPLGAGGGFFGRFGGAWVKLN